MSAAGKISYSVSIGIISVVVAFLEFGNGYGNPVPSACIYAVKNKNFLITGSVEEESRSQKYIDTELFRKYSDALL